ncbi:MAG: glycosyltransferase family 2 protein [Raoultibacter sp.]
MIEASSYFIVFEFLRRYFSSFKTAPVDVFDLLIWGGASLLILSFVILLRDSPGKTARILYTGAMALQLVCLVLFAVSIFLFTHTFVEQWALRVLNIEPPQLYSYALLVLFGISGITTSIAAGFMPKKPENNSGLNGRQILQAYSFLAALIVVGIACWNWAHQAFEMGMLSILLITEVVSIFIWFYDAFIYILSRTFPAKPKAIREPTHGHINRFAIVISARNEEKVIGSLVESLFSMNYPRDKYTVYVICDNCTDKTSSIALEKGAITLERNDLARKGKHEALKWFFTKLESDEKPDTNYDAYVILSADNLVNDQYLSEINEHLNEGHEVMQSYLGCKNPHDTITAKCNSVGLWLGNANYQEARARLNLNAQARGTGLVVRPSVLQEIPWESDCLTEELDFSTRYLLKKNASCHWVHSARLYAEQPLTLKTSINQRTRWMQGHMATMMKYGPKLLGSAIRNVSLRQLDACFNLMRPFFVLFTLIVYALRWILLLMFPNSIAGESFLMSFETALVLAIAYVLMQSYVLSTESNLRYALWLPVYYLYNISWSLPIFRGFIKRHETFWVSTFHARNLSINDVSEDLQMSEARRRLAGLENLHALPLGQILLKAAIITGAQLKLALSIQEKNGGSLGNILLETGAISAETLSTYIGIQQVMRESSYYDPLELHTLQLGEILVNAKLITRDQLGAALVYQKEHGGRIGEAVVSLRILSPEVLRIFLEVQKVIGANYLDEQKARELIKSMSYTTTSYYHDIDSFVVGSGLVSKQQLETAQIFGETHDKSLFDSLLYLGYISPETLETIEEALKASDQSLRSWPQAEEGV